VRSAAPSLGPQALVTVAHAMYRLAYRDEAALLALLERTKALSLHIHPPPVHHQAASPSAASEGSSFPQQTELRLRDVAQLAVALSQLQCPGLSEWLSLVGCGEHPWTPLRLREGRGDSISGPQRPASEPPSSHPAAPPSPPPPSLLDPGDKRALLNLAWAHAVADVHERWMADLVVGVLIAAEDGGEARAAGGTGETFEDVEALDSHAPSPAGRSQMSEDGSKISDPNPSSEIRSTFQDSSAPRSTLRHPRFSTLPINLLDRSQAFHYLIVAQDVGLLSPIQNVGLLSPIRHLESRDRLARAWLRCKEAWLSTSLKPVGGATRGGIVSVSDDSDGESSIDAAWGSDNAGSTSSAGTGSTSSAGMGGTGSSSSSSSSALQRDVFRVMRQLCGQGGGRGPSAFIAGEEGAAQAVDPMQQELERGSAIRASEGRCRQLLDGASVHHELLDGASVHHELATEDGLFSIDVAVLIPVAIAAAPQRVTPPPPSEEAGDGPSRRSTGSLGIPDGGCTSLKVVRIAIEVDGPSHYTTTAPASVSDTGGRRPTGATELRNRCLMRRGWETSIIPWWEWDAMAGDDVAKEMYLMGKILRIVNR